MKGVKGAATCWRNRERGLKAQNSPLCPSRAAEIDYLLMKGRCKASIEERGKNEGKTE